MSWFTSHAAELLTLAWGLREIWTAKGSTKRRAIETAKVIDRQAHEIALWGARREFDRTIDELREKADEGAAWAEIASARIEAAWRL